MEIKKSDGKIGENGFSFAANNGRGFEKYGFWRTPF